MWAIRPSGENRLLVLILISLALGGVAFGATLFLGGFCFLFFPLFPFVLDDDKPYF